MAANDLPYDPQQMMLLPEATQDWLPARHLAFFIDDAVDGLDVSCIACRPWKLACMALNPRRIATLTTR